VSGSVIKFCDLYFVQNTVLLFRSVFSFSYISFLRAGIKLTYYLLKPIIIKQSE